MRKDTREEVKKHGIDGIKPNDAALAKQCGCDYRTVKAAYHEALEEGKRPVQRKKRPGKLIQVKWLSRANHKAFYSLIKQEKN